MSKMGFSSVSPVEAVTKTPRPDLEGAMNNYERLLDCLVMPFIDPKTALEEWKRRKPRKLGNSRSVGEKRCETGAKRSP